MLLNQISETVHCRRERVCVVVVYIFTAKMAQINGYKEELQDELQKTDPNSHASRLIAQGKYQLLRENDEMFHLLCISPACLHVRRGHVRAARNLGLAFYTMSSVFDICLQGIVIVQIYDMPLGVPLS